MDNDYCFVARDGKTPISFNYKDYPVILVKKAGQNINWFYYPSSDHSRIDKLLYFSIQSISADVEKKLEKITYNGPPPLTGEQKIEFATEGKYKTLCLLYPFNNILTE